MDLSSPLEQLGYLFYVASPNKTSFETVEEVPDYTVRVIPHFALFIFLEICILHYKKKRTFRLNDAVGSVSQGLFQELTKLVILNVQLVSYIYIYNNWRLVSLPWNSPWTWWFCFLGVDFCYYWLHRASHEINILWAAHQVHHSSEDYNLSTALRQSVLQNYGVWINILWTSHQVHHSSEEFNLSTGLRESVLEIQTTWVFNLPLAFAIPPSVFLVHTQFNLLYQFWIHTEVITKLGPLEYIFNTASHHRVHHGRNRYCIDKNYAGVLIIWDRMFGTFQPEKEEVVYGLTHPLNSFELFYVQFCHYIHIWKTFWATEGFWNKISVIFKGPGWSPGTPWHGNEEDIPDVKAPVEKFDPPLPLWCKLYAWFHLLILALGYYEISDNTQVLSQMILWSFFFYEVFSLSILGMLLEGRLYAEWIELCRCCLYLVIDYFFIYSADVSRIATSSQVEIIFFLRIVFATSFFFWLQYCLRRITVKMYSTKLKKSE